MGPTCPILSFSSSSLSAGKWHKVCNFEDIRDRAVFETFTEGYMFAEDSGYFTVGDPRKEGAECSRAQGKVRTPIDHRIGVVPKGRCGHQ